MDNIDLNNGFSDTRPQMWSSEEIRELILYAKDLEQQMEDANAKLIMMNTKLELEEKKVTRLTNILKAFNLWQ
jgi:gentisate 1,2-dioxygenase